MFSARFLILVAILSMAVLPVCLLAAESTIAPGDTIRITVLGEPDQSKQVVVDDDGRIALPLAKDIQVAGKTTSQAATEIARALSGFIKNPDVTVEMVQRVKRQVTVAGQVRNPGVYALERDTRLMEVLGLAGGMTEAADPAKVTVTRRDTSEPIKCDLQSFLAGNMDTANVILQDGDVILIPERSPSIGTVFVYGPVRQPGVPIQIREGMRVSEAVSSAGGIIPELADTTRCTIRRANAPEPITIDLSRALAGDPSADITLMAGDTITVPTIEQSGTFTIFGSVANPGEFPIKGRMTVAKAVASAGATPRAKITDVTLTRTDASNKTESMKINLKQVTEGRIADVTVQPGDTIYVPEGRERPDLIRLLGLGVGIAALIFGN